MPLGLGARINLAAASLNGSLRPPQRRPRLLAAGFTSPPVMGKPSEFRWRATRTSGGFLHIEQPENIALCHSPVGGRGSVTIPILAPTPIYVSLELHPKRMQMGSEPARFNLPPVLPIIPCPRCVRIDVSPATVSLNDRFTVEWNATDAAGVDLIINDGENVSKETHHPSGVRTIIASRTGRWMLRLTAQGTHAQTTESRTITVSIPEPRFDIPQRVIAGPPGTRGAFSWHITHAVRAYFLAPAREQRSDACLEGSFPIEIGDEAEAFYLIAVGLDGRRSRVELRAEPYGLNHLFPET